MIGNAGVCIVLAGNKAAGEKTVPADGVREEVAIALAQGKPVIPIGATGHVAREVWERCQSNPKEFMGSVDLAAQLSVLGDTTAGVEAIVQATVDALKRLDM